MAARWKHSKRIALGGLLAHLVLCCDLWGFALPTPANSQATRFPGSVAGRRSSWRRPAAGRHSRKALAISELSARSLSSFAAVWAKLSPRWPFSWVDWFFGQIAAAPSWMRVYVIYSLVNMFAKMLLPGLHAQLMVGTELGFLKAFNKRSYANSVAERLRALLIKQAKLGVRPGQKAPELSKDVLDSLCERAKDDAVLLEALGSTTTLRIWHKLERTPLDSPELKQQFGAQSQELWLLEALQNGYYGDVKRLAKESSLAALSTQAWERCESLKKAVDIAAFGAQQGVKNPTLLQKVEKASAEAASSLEALNKAREDTKLEGADLWEGQLRALQAAHKNVPAVQAELQRLADVS